MQPTVQSQINLDAPVAARQLSTLEAARYAIKFPREFIYEFFHMTLPEEPPEKRSESCEFLKLFARWQLRIFFLFFHSYGSNRIAAVLGIEEQVVRNCLCDVYKHKRFPSSQEFAVFLAEHKTFYEAAKDEYFRFILNGRPVYRRIRERPNLPLDINLNEMARIIVAKTRQFSGFQMKQLQKNGTRDAVEVKSVLAYLLHKDAGISTRDLSVLFCSTTQSVLNAYARVEKGRGKVLLDKIRGELRKESQADFLVAG